VTPDTALATLWRRWKLFLAVAVLCLGAVTAVTFTLAKRYQATATIYVGTTKDVGEALAVDSAVGERLTRTFTALSSNPNVVDAVVARLPYDVTRTQVLARMSFAPVERTQLLEVRAEESSPRRAQQLANVYAQTFVERTAEQFRAGRVPTEISLNEPAAVPTRASKPNPPLYLGLGALLSLVLAAGAVLLRERLDDRLDVRDEDTAVLGEPLIARIPAIPRGARPDAPEVFDAFRLLKANLDLASASNVIVLGLTSPGPGDGNSVVAANLARATAQAGERTVLVEADLRAPSGGGGSSRRGLAAFLAGDAGVDDIVRGHRELNGLDVVRSGGPVANPGALLVGDRLGLLLAQLSERYDRVILDASPIGVGADATLTLAQADAAVLVVDARETRRPRGLAALHQLRRANRNVLGVVLNRAAPGYAGVAASDRGAADRNVRVSGAARS
jgi:capsular exopolysaccharide synthesis family protein